MSDKIVLGPDFGICQRLASLLVSIEVDDPAFHDKVKAAIDWADEARLKINANTSEKFTDTAMENFF